MLHMLIKIINYKLITSSYCAKLIFRKASISIRNFALEIGWPKDASDSSLSLKVLIITFESLSRMIELVPIS